MAVLALTDAYIVINSNTLSSSGNKLELSVQVDDLDVTAFGATYKSRIGGLKDASLNITFNQDFANAALDSIIWPLLGTVVTFEVRPTSGTVTTSNPKWTGSVLIKEWVPIGNGVGEKAEVSVSWPTSGTVTRGTS